MYYFSGYHKGMGATKKKNLKRGNAITKSGINRRNMKEIHSMVMKIDARKESTPD